MLLKIYFQILDIKFRKASISSYFCDFPIGASLEAQDCHGLTPLHEAAYKGHEKTYDLLCTLPTANIDIKDNMGNLAMHYFVDYSKQSNGNMTRK